MKFDVLLTKDKKFPQMSSLQLSFLRHMDEKKTWREVPAIHRHAIAIALLWVSIDLVKRLQKCMKVKEILKVHTSPVCEAVIKLLLISQHS